MNACEFTRLLDEFPIIASVKDDMGLKESLSSACRVVFVLYGDLLSISGIVEAIAAAGKAPIVHLDLVDGLAARESAVDYISKMTPAVGVISTKSVLIKRARQVGLIAIQRFFLLDSLALSNIRKQAGANAPDVIEVIPGAMPKVISGLCENISVPIIAGGLIRDIEDAAGAIHAGAKAISTTNSEFWRKSLLQS